MQITYMTIRRNLKEMKILMKSMKKKMKITNKIINQKKIQMKLTPIHNLTTSNLLVNMKNVGKLLKLKNL